LRNAIISDVHGNIQALEAVIAAIKRLGVDQVLCLGDVVGYGARPVECVTLVWETCRSVLLGNHDAAATGRGSVEDFNPVAKSAIEWTRDAITDRESGYLEGLPYLFNGGGYAGTHSTFSDPGAWKYVFSSLDAAVEFKATGEEILFYGHTHYPVVFTLEDRRVVSQRISELDLSPHQRYIVNVGSVGQPRDGNPDACFVIYDNAAQRIEYQRVPYNVRSAQRDILETSIPRELALRLSIGR